MLCNAKYYYNLNPEIETWLPRAGTGTRPYDYGRGIVHTITVDDCNVDSRFRGNDEMRGGNDEMRGGLWVSAGGHRNPPLRLR